MRHVCSELGATTGGAGGVNAPAAADAEWQQLHLSPFDAVEQPGAEPLALKARPRAFVAVSLCPILALLRPM